METMQRITKLGEKVLSGENLTFDEAFSLTDLPDNYVPLLLGVANLVREKFTGNKVDTCEIINARSGNCSEDCIFCAQSAHHRTTCPTYPLLQQDEILSAAKEAEGNGASRFCIVTAGCGSKHDTDFPDILKAIEKIGRETTIDRCCSLGILEPEHVEALKKAGITRYHHNLEGSRSFFPQICTTHTYDERVATVRLVKAAGLQTCVGGLFGLGETWRQRIELAFELKELDVDSVPMNILNPVPGTPLANKPVMRPWDILKLFAIYRLILPTKILRFAGGRERALGELLPLGFVAGINGMLIGNYLTTEGQKPAETMHTVRQLGLEPSVSQASQERSAATATV